MTWKKSKSAKILAGICSAALASTMCLSGCTSGGTSTEAASSSDGLTFSITDMDLEYTDRDKDASYDESEATKIDLSSAGKTVTIDKEGVYILSGTAKDTQVLVDCSSDDAKVQLVLDGADITCTSGPAIYVKSANKCFVTLADGSENTLSDATGYTLTDDDGDEEPTAALFSKADLTLQGTGKLTVNGNCNNGIGSKDDLVITGGDYVINAANDGLRGKDCIKVCDGTFDITAKEDAVKSNEDEDTTKGFVLIDGGTWTVNAGDDAFHAETALIVNDGDIDVESSYEGFEGVQIYINGGNSNITASDDGINAASGSTADAAGGENDHGANFQHGDRSDAGGNDSGNAGGNASGNAGGNASSASSENSSSDGQSGKLMGKIDSSNMPKSNGQGGTGGGFDSDSSCTLQISGGTLTVNSDGDGLDSNGNIVISGGDIIVNGPTSGGNGAIDYGTEATISGGTIIAFGSAGMAESFTSGTQAFALVNATGNEGDNVTVTTSAGDVILSATAVKSFQTVVVSSPEMSSSTSCTLDVGSNSTNFTPSTERS